MTKEDLSPRDLMNNIQKVVTPSYAIGRVFFHYTYDVPWSDFKETVAHKHQIAEDAKNIVFIEEGDEVVSSGETKGIHTHDKADGYSGGVPYKWLKK